MEQLVVYAWLGAAYEDTNTEQAVACAMVSVVTVTHSLLSQAVHMHQKVSTTSCGRWFISHVVWFFCAQDGSLDWVILQALFKACQCL